ncbi:ABC transporter ATP-binding protein [Paenibacillus antri]|uniref:ABC transporter ATP-binding protein n=1 Tax=Paenibacillus antri TaxID=2582848 RepID=A0A5R9GCZ0_9BACL|nr:ABC transporter ATP-binding protein [Paenibacillus antri]TLS51238.1 ABC transporter ATP-binding protein [Paenibacillus antri]
MKPVLELERFVKARGDFRLGPIDLAVEEGLIVALVGPNGSGKSTLFRSLMGLLHPDGGTLRVFGEAAYPANDIGTKSRIGFVGDSLTPADEGMTVLQWKQFVARWFKSWNEATWNRLSERLELEPKKKLKELSTGMTKRLEFALAVSHDPELLLLDEPSSGLDPFAWRIMMDEIRTFMDGGDRTVFVATHIMEEVRRLADLIVFLYKGRIVGVYEKDRLMDDWKTMWIGDGADRVRTLPGVVAVEEGRGAGGGTRFVTSDARRAEAELRALGIAPLETRAVELEDILWHLMETDKRKSGGV